MPVMSAGVGDLVPEHQCPVELDNSLSGRKRVGRAPSRVDGRDERSALVVCGEPVVCEFGEGCGTLAGVGRLDFEDVGDCGVEAATFVGQHVVVRGLLEQRVPERVRVAAWFEPSSATSRCRETASRRPYGDLVRPAPRGGGDLGEQAGVNAATDDCRDAENALRLRRAGRRSG